MTLSIIAMLAFLVGYVTYYFLRFNIAMKHKILIVSISGMSVTILAAAVIYFVILYKDYPAYISITLNLVLMIFGFCGGYLTDKLSDKYINNKVSDWRKKWLLDTKTNLEIH